MCHSREGGNPHAWTHASLPSQGHGAGVTSKVSIKRFINMTTLLEVKNLVTRFYTEEGVVHAVNGISYNLDRGESMALVGESGCGKSVSALSLLGLVPSPPGLVEDGQVLFNGVDLLQKSERELRHIRGGEIGMVFQDPMT